MYIFLDEMVKDSKFWMKNLSKKKKNINWGHFGLMLDINDIYFYESCHFGLIVSILLIVLEH